MVSVGWLCLLAVVVGCMTGTADAGLYGANSNVIELSADNFAQEVFGSRHIWLVEFYAPWCGHCKRLTPEWEQAATKLKGLVKIGAVNCDEEKNKQLAGYFGIQGFPTIKFFGHKTEPTPDKKGVIKKPTDYNGAREAAAIVQYALAQLPTDFVTLVKTDADYAAIKQQQLPHPIVLLFTDKSTTTPLARALSLDFPFYQVASSVASALSDFAVDAFPRIAVLNPDGATNFYDGKLEHKPIYDFLATHIKRTENKQQQQQQQPAAPKSDEPFQVWKVDDQASFEQRCLKRLGLCVVAFLDAQDEEADSLDQYLSALTAVGQQATKKTTASFMWLDGPSHADFAAAFEVSAFPGLAVYAPGKKSYVPYYGAFEEKKIDAFISQVLQAKKRSVPIDSVPVLSAAANKDEL